MCLIILGSAAPLGFSNEYIACVGCRCVVLCFQMCMSVDVDVVVDVDDAAHAGVGRVLVAGVAY